jgi:hypothetical protein
VREQAAEQKAAGLFVPEERRLVDLLDRAGRQVDSLSEADLGRVRWLAAHPEVPGRLRELDTEIAGLDRDLDAERRAVVRELNPQPERTPGRSLAWDHHRSIEPPDLGYDFGL